MRAPSPSYTPPKVTPAAPMRVTPEVDKAVIDERERRKRASMSREMSRMFRVPILKAPPTPGFSQLM